MRSTARLGGLVLIDSLGVKFGGRDEVEIADIYALPADEVVRRTFADPGKGARLRQRSSDAAVEEVARDREAAVLYGWRPFMHNPSLRHWLHRIKVPGARHLGRAGPYRRAFLWRPPDPAAAERPLRRRSPNAGHYPQVEQLDAVATAIADFAKSI